VNAPKTSPLKLKRQIVIITVGHVVLISLWSTLTDYGPWGTLRNHNFTKIKKYTRRCCCMDARYMWSHYLFHYDSLLHIIPLDRHFEITMSQKIHMNPTTETMRSYVQKPLEVQMLCMFLCCDVSYCVCRDLTVNCSLIQGVLPDV
jgi:hypothetical protein